MRAHIEEAIVLAKALVFAAKPVPARSTMSILQHVRLAILGTRLEVTATDLDLEHRAIVEVTGAADGIAVVPAGRLAGLVSALPPDAGVELVLEDQALRIQCRRGRYRLPTLPAADFPPPLAVDPDAVAFTLQAADARALCDRLRYAASDEELRYYLTGVNVQEQHGRLVCVSTDGHRLAQVTLEVDPGRDLNVIMPAHTVETLKMLAGVGDVQVAIDAAKINLTAGPWSAASKLIDASFPDYRRVIPVASSNQVTIPRPDLLAVLKRLKGVSCRASEKEPISVGITWDDRKADVEFCLPRDAANVETLESSAVSGAAAVAVKLDYLVETLEALSRQAVCFDHSGPGSPVLITAPDDPLEPALAVIMPMAEVAWHRDEPPAGEVHQFKAKPRGRASSRAPEPGDAA